MTISICARGVPPGECQKPYTHCVHGCGSVKNWERALLCQLLTGSRIMWAKNILAGVVRFAEQWSVQRLFQHGFPTRENPHKWSRSQVYETIASTLLKPGDRQMPLVGATLDQNQCLHWGLVQWHCYIPIGAIYLNRWFWNRRRNSISWKKPSSPGAEWLSFWCWKIGRNCAKVAKYSWQLLVLCWTAGYIQINISHERLEWYTVKTFMRIFGTNVVHENVKLLTLENLIYAYISKALGSVCATFFQDLWTSERLHILDCDDACLAVVPNISYGKWTGVVYETISFVSDLIRPDIYLHAVLCNVGLQDNTGTDSVK